MRPRCAARLLLAGLLCAIGALVAVGPALAQDDELAISNVDTENYPDVSIEFGAPPDISASRGRPAVTVLENGEPRPARVARTTAENIELVVAIDTSGSMAGAPIEQAIVAAQTLVEALPPDSRVALVAFGNEPVILAEFTTDANASLESIAAIQVDPAAETSLYDAARVAIRQFGPSPTGPRYVVIVTDGGDTISEGTLGQAQAAVQASEIPVFAVSLVTTESDPSSLAALTAGTGGAVIEATDPAALSGLTQQIGAAIAAQFEVVYESEATGSALVEITIERGEATATGSVNVDLPRPLPAVAPTPTARPEPTATPIEEIAIPATITAPDGGPGWLLPVGLLVTGIALAVFFGYLLWPVRKRRKPLRDLAPPAAADVARSSGNLLAASSQTLVRAAERIVAARDDEGRLAVRIDRAGIRMRPAEFLTLTVLVAVVAGLVGLIVNFGFAILFAGLATAAMLGMLSFKGNRRAREFEEQLPMTLRVMSGGLRGGFSLSQVIDLVTTESKSPTCDEFARLGLEENLGRDITDSFRDIGERMDSADFKWVAEAVDINRSVGGDLAEVLEAVAETVRTRKRVKGQIRTLSAEGRLSAAILLALPFITFAGEMIVNRELASQLYTTTEGRVSIVIGLTLMSIATVWMRRIVRLEY